MESEAAFLTAYEQIKSAQQSTLSEVEKAIQHEESKRNTEAIEGYERCLQLIDEIFTIPVGLPQNLEAVEPEWNDACVIIQKLKKVKTEIAYRLKVVRAKNTTVDDSAEEAIEEQEQQNDTSDSDTAEPVAKKKSLLLDNPIICRDIRDENETAKSFKDIINGLRDIMATKEANVLFDTLFQSQCKLYKIHANGSVSTVSGETSMSMVLCTTDGDWSFLNGTYFIQCSITQPIQNTKCGDGASTSTTETSNLIWMYPLIPGVTNCYSTEYGAFIFPDMECVTPGESFGIMISDKGPATEDEFHELQEFFHDLLEAVLGSTVEKLKEPTGLRKPRDTSQQVSQHIVSAADFIARNLVKGAGKTGELMVKTTPYIISKMSPAPENVQPISSKVHTSVEVAKNVTSAAAGATGWIAGKVGSASAALGRFLAPHIQNQGANLLQKGFGYDNEEANTKMDNAFTLVAGAVEGFSTVYMGLETSAKILGNSLSENSVKIIEHKYGKDVGNVAAGTFESLGNAFVVSQNVNYITPKGIAKKMAKTTGKAVVDDYKRSLRHEESYILPAGALTPFMRVGKESLIEN